MEGSVRATAPAGPVTVKCLIWDLDDTLWDGTLAEGDEVRPRAGVRQVLTELDSRGILQSVSSRNDHDAAWERLSALGLAEYFVFPAIGFGAKSAAVRQIASRLRFDLGAIAFIDDHPAERAEVAFHLPQVRCYPAEQMTSLPSLPEFTPAAVTAEARSRRQLYQASQQREAAQAGFAGPDEEFIRSLRLVMRISRATGPDLARIEELTLRTSQMNATGVHYPDAALRALLADPGHTILVTSLSDRFGSYGTVGVILLAMRRAVWHIKLLATSCRVVACGAGSVLLSWLSGQAAQAGAHLVADFRARERNRIAELAYRFAGFTESPCGCQAALEPAADPGIQRFHLHPRARAGDLAMRLVGPSLAVSETASGLG
jgi:methoxymalonate biosynthesis protein